jgi:hypothetical protein
MKCDKCEDTAVVMIGPRAYCQVHYDWEDNRFPDPRLKENK